MLLPTKLEQRTTAQARGVFCLNQNLKLKLRSPTLTHSPRAGDPSTGGEAVNASRLAHACG